MSLKAYCMEQLVYGFGDEAVAVDASTVDASGTVVSSRTSSSALVCSASSIQSEIWMNVENI